MELLSPSLAAVIRPPNSSILSVCGEDEPLSRRRLQVSGVSKTKT
jgi:hypothetical protein